MAELDGKTPQVIAKDIVKAAFESTMVELSGVRGQELDKIIRYKHSRELYSKGEKHYEKMRDQWRSEFVERVIESTFTQQEKVIAKADLDAKVTYFNLLVSRGTAKDVALEMSGL